MLSIYFENITCQNYAYSLVIYRSVHKIRSCEGNIVSANLGKSTLFIVLFEDTVRSFAGRSSN